MPDRESIGRLFGVGVGPGDPELLTLKAARVLAGCGVIAHFAARGRDGNAYAIIHSLVRPDQVVQFGLPPRRIDILTSIRVAFEEAWAGRVNHDVGGRAVPFLGRADLVRNKKSSGRTKDLADLEALGEDPRP